MQLELNGRNFTQLVTLTPGVVSQTGQDEGTVGINGNVPYSINGGRTEYNNWELDGGDNMDNGSNSTLNVYPNIEAIAEFKVLTSNYGAQYGRNGSGTIEVETKSGDQGVSRQRVRISAQRHLQRAFRGNQGRIRRTRSRRIRSTISATPSAGRFSFRITTIRRSNKTFFFWSQEWRREKNPSTIQLKVPSDAERGGDFSDLLRPAPIARNVANPAVRSPGISVPVDPKRSFCWRCFRQANGTNNGASRRIRNPLRCRPHGAKNWSASITTSPTTTG